MARTPGCQAHSVVAAAAAGVLVYTSSPADSSVARTTPRTSSWAPAGVLVDPRRDVNGVAAIILRGYAAGWRNAPGRVLPDLCYALRKVRGNPGFTLAAVASLAIPIGFNTRSSTIDLLLFLTHCSCSRQEGWRSHRSA